MPNFYTHLRFGREVLWELTPELQKRLTREWGSYMCGNFGPDPLYFAGNNLRHAGLEIHRGSGRRAMERFRQPLEKGTPWAVSFASGYLFHFLLDSAMHPVVYRAMEETGCSHRRIEGEFDRYLMEKDGVTLEEAFPKWQHVDAFASLAAQMAPGVTREDYIRGVKEFRNVSLKLCQWTGSPMVAVMNGVGLIPGVHGARGAVLRKKPDSKTMPWMEKMEAVFLETVKTAPGVLEETLKAASRGIDFRGLPDTDYSGKRGG